MVLLQIELDGREHNIVKLYCANKLTSKKDAVKNMILAFGDIYGDEMAKELANKSKGC